MADRFLILTPNEAIAVRGPSSSGAALDPRGLLDGSFILPLRVLADPAHAVYHALLGACPQRDVDPSEFPVEST